MSGVLERGGGGRAGPARARRGGRGRAWGARRAHGPASRAEAHAGPRTAGAFVAQVPGALRPAWGCGHKAPGAAPALGREPVVRGPPG